MEYVGTKDLFRRWPVYTPRGLRKLMAKPEFPQPAFTINQGKTPAWYLPDIVKFESNRPELTSETAKLRKVAGYAAGILKKKARKA